MDLAPGNYSYRVRAFDRIDYGAWSSSWFTFTVDTTAPPAPTVGSTAYPADGSWNGGAGTAGSFTLTPGTGTASLSYWLGEDVPATVMTTTATTVSVTPPTAGVHTLYVQAKDKAGNSSTLTEHTFNVAPAAVISPVEGDRTARRFVLAAAGRTDLTGVTFQYRQGAAGTWRDLPTGDVVRADGSTVTWPVPTTVTTTAATVDNLRWDAVNTLGGRDGAVELRAVFTGTTPAETAPVHLVVDQQASSATTDSVGPGEVNLLTGDYSVSGSDGGPFGLSVSRSTSSRNTAIGDKTPGMVAPFGPQWAVGGLAAAESAPYQAVRTINASSAEVVLADATTIQFLKTGGTGTGTTWEAEPGAQALKLTGTGASGSPFLLSDTGGSQTRFREGTGPLYVIETTTPASATTANTTRFSYEAVTVGGTSKLRLKRLMAATSAVSDLGTCDVAAPPTGCRVLEVVYTPDSTLAPAAGTTGVYPGRAEKLVLHATAPGGTGTTATTLTSYTYDSAGRLVRVADPRASGLSTSYGYDADGRVTSVTPAGEEPWTVFYANLNVGGDTNPGRLTKAVRADATTSVVYAVPMSGTEAPRNLTEPASSAWGQTGREVPSDATAVFPPDYVPPTHVGGAGVNWTRAAVTYLDPAGGTTNTLTPGNRLDFTAYDEHGNTVRQLSAANLDLSQAPATDGRLVELGLHTQTGPARATQLAQVSVYDPTGQRELESFGPLHLITAPGAEHPAPGRAHTVNTYDQGRPDGAVASDLVTTSATGARMAGSSVDTDVRTTTTEYNWTLGVPTKNISDPGGLNIVTTTSYDGQGRVTRTTQPKSSALTGDDAGVTLTRYYTAGAHPTVAACGNKPGFADLVCQTAPGAAITGAPAGQPTTLPTATITYTVLGAADVVTETTVDASGATKTRTTDTDYDAAARPNKVTVTGGLGTAIPVITTTYDPNTGRATTTTATEGTTTSTITRGYDTLGRLTSYTDAGGAKTTTAYDTLDRPTTITRGDGGTTLTYAYDTTTGAPTSVTDSVAGKITGAYDAGGNLIQQTLPGGVTMTQSTDTTGTTTSRDWVKTNSDGTTTDLSLETVSENAHGQWISHTSRNGARAYGYDKAARLTSVTDTSGDICAVRVYGFDANTNRTHFKQATGPSDACPATPGLGTADYTYDTADRLVNTGYNYDAFGRTTALPGTQGIDYYTNDLVRGITKTTGDTQTWTLDPALRFRSYTRTVSGTAVTKTNHYIDDNDSPAWITEGTEPGAPITRNIIGLTGDLVAATNATGGLRLQLANLHGDIILDIEPTGTGTTDLVHDTDEYGNPKTTPAQRYGWLGGKQRSRDTPNGLILMGVRLYAPSLGRFLQVDPIQGAGANAYEYALADPLNVFDLDGRKPDEGGVSYADLIRKGLNDAEARAYRKRQAGAPMSPEEKKAYNRGKLKIIRYEKVIERERNKQRRQGNHKSKGKKKGKSKIKIPRTGPPRSGGNDVGAGGAIGIIIWCYFKDC